MSEKKTKKKMGRPASAMAKIDAHKLGAFMRLKPTLKDTAYFFEVSEDTIEIYIRKKFDLTFSEFRDKNMIATRFNLIRTAITQAQSGNTPMLIFSLKNLCGWTDKTEVSGNSEKPVTMLSYSADAIKKYGSDES